ncbi:hypothetical protein E4U23_000825 [Claviceps purpurea]|nr:hypothetical protein E4U23_000825 [Claviceps purpurea]
MAANMQQMAGPGQMASQQPRRSPASIPLHQVVYQNIVNSSQTISDSTSWQAGVNANERMGKAMDLISNIALGVPNMDHMRAAELGCHFERDTFHKSPSKEEYDQKLANKTLEFFQKRQQNEANIQNALNASKAQAQAVNPAQTQQTMMNMQAQAGRGMDPAQSGFHLQHQMQGAPLAQQAHQAHQQPQLQQQQMGMSAGINMNSVNQGGRGAGTGTVAMPPTQQAMAMQNRQLQSIPHEIALLNPIDRAKVLDAAMKTMASIPDQQKANIKLGLQQRLPPQQYADIAGPGMDPVLWFYQNQAFHTYKSNMTRIQQEQQQQYQQQQQQQQQLLLQQAAMQNQNGGQVAAAALMQQQQSQQSFQQRQNMLNANQPTDFSQFAPNMESIKDQQMNGLMAQQAGQMVVPASSGGAQHTTPQAGPQIMAGAQALNQTPRHGQQQSHQQQLGTTNVQQMQMSQAASKNPNQVPLKIQQQPPPNPPNHPNGPPPAQSPGMNTLNTPVSRAPVAMNPAGGVGMGQGSVTFGDQRFNQGIQRPNNQAFNNMLANMPAEQRASLQGLSADKLNEIFRKWQSQRHEQSLNGGPMNQSQNRPQNQYGGQMNMNLGPTTGAPGLPPQPIASMPVNQQQQMQVPRIPIQSQQAQALMDTMELPPQVQSIIGQVPMNVKTWRDAKLWLSQNGGSLAPHTRNQLYLLQQRQFQAVIHKRNMQQSAGQNLNANSAGMPNAGVQMASHQQQQQQQQQHHQQMAMQRQLGNIPPQVLQVTPQELASVRAQRPDLASLHDQQLRLHVLQIKKTSWQSQQQAQMRAQALHHSLPPGQPQTPGPQQLGGQTPMQMQQTPQQPNRTPTSQTQASPPNVAQTASMRSAAQRPQQKGQAAATNTHQARVVNTQPQPAKSLKRPNPDDAADTPSMPHTAPRPAPPPPSQPSQQIPKGVPTLSPSQLSALGPADRAKYDQLVKLQTPPQSQGPVVVNNIQQPTTESLNRLRAIMVEEQRQVGLESMYEVRMSPQERSETGAKLQRIAAEINKFGRVLTRWYALTGDDVRAKMFFRARLRVLKQFANEDDLTKVKEILSIHTTEIDSTRNMLESMYYDLSNSALPQNRGMLKPGQQPGQATKQMQSQTPIQTPIQSQSQNQGQSQNKNKPQSKPQNKPQSKGQSKGQKKQNQNQSVQSVAPQQQPQPIPQQQQQAQQQSNQQQQLPQQQQPLQQNSQGAPTPLNAANLEKNSQALKSQQQKSGGRGVQVPPAPTVAQPPFSFGASSPHGNPSYIGKPKDINLQLPPARKKAKLSGPQPVQTPQSGASPSPKNATKNVSPEVRRQEPPKPVFLCKEPDCDMAAFGFPSDEALQSHIEEDHIKPREDPLKFAKENLAMALGLELDGTPKKTSTPGEGAAAAAAATATSTSTALPKQGPAPRAIAAARGVPGSHDAALKKTTGPVLSKGANVKATKPAADAIDTTRVKNNVWAGYTIDTQVLLSNLGYENGLPNFASDAAAVYRCLTPNDTPESSKDSGASEPNSDISEGAALEIDMKWQPLDADLVLNLDHADLEGGDWGDFDPEALLNPDMGVPDWDDDADYSSAYNVDGNNLSLGY